MHVCAYAFGRVGLCVYAMYVAKKLAVWGFTTWKFLIGAIIDKSNERQLNTSLTSLLIKFNSQKKKLTTPGDRFRKLKKFEGILLAGWEKGSRKIILQ